MENARSEIWRPVLQGAYSVSNLGRVRRDAGYDTTWKGRILKFDKSRNGYYFVRPSVNNRSKKISVHSLVAEAFIGPRPNGKVINHKNGIKTDNRPENIEYVSNRENHIHAASLGLKAMGERNGSSVLRNKEVLFIIRLGQDFSHRELAKKFGVGKSTITRILRGKTWKHLKGGENVTAS